MTMESLVDPGIPTFGEYLVGCRKNNGLTLTELSRRTKVSKGYLSALEHGHQKNPSARILEALSAVLPEFDGDLDVNMMPPGQAREALSARQNRTTIDYRFGGMGVEAYVRLEYDIRAINPVAAEELTTAAHSLVAVLEAIRNDLPGTGEA